MTGFVRGGCGGGVRDLACGVGWWGLELFKIVGVGLVWRLWCGWEGGSAHGIVLVSRCAGEISSDWLQRRVNPFRCRLFLGIGMSAQLLEGPE